mgnify:CR=1 FL=1
MTLALAMSTAAPANPIFQDPGVEVSNLFELTGKYINFVTYRYS